MEPHLLDSFAAHSVGTTLSDFTRAQRVPADRPRRPRRRRAVAVLGTTLGVAAPAVAAVVVVVAR